LLDAELLAEVYVELIDARQATLILVENGGGLDRRRHQIAASRVRPQPLAVRLTPEELGAHRSFVATLGDAPLWNGYRSIILPDDSVQMNIAAIEQAAPDQAGAALP
jgi:DNA polymerase III subunit epsilon